MLVALQAAPVLRPAETHSVVAEEAEAEPGLDSQSTMQAAALVEMAVSEAYRLAELVWAVLRASTAQAAVVAAVEATASRSVEAQAAPAETAETATLESHGKNPWVSQLETDATSLRET
jgi:hypothetical protein